MVLPDVLILLQIWTILLNILNKPDKIYPWKLNITKIVGLIIGKNNVLIHKPVVV